MPLFSRFQTNKFQNLGIFEIRRKKIYFIEFSSGV